MKRQEKTFVSAEACGGLKNAVGGASSFPPDIPITLFKAMEILKIRNKGFWSIGRRDSTRDGTDGCNRCG